MIENVQRLSNLLESESKRRSAAEHEKETISREKLQLQSAFNALSTELDNLKQASKVIEKKSSSATDNNSPAEDHLRQKVLH